MSIADMLAKTLEEKQMSKNEVIRKTGIDRSSFYQILGNRRMATPVQFLKIINVLQPDAADRIRFLGQYERERVGDEKFVTYEKARAFLRKLSGEDAGAEKNNGSGHRVSEYGGEKERAEKESVEKTPAQQDGDSAVRTSCPEVMASMIRQEVKKGGNIKFRLLLPMELCFALGIEKVLEENIRSGSRVYVEQLLSDWDGRSAAEPMILAFADYLRFLGRTPGFFLNAYMTDEVLFHPEGTPYPFYIIGVDAMVMFDRTGNKCICVQDPTQIRDFTEHFDMLIHHADPVVELNHDLTEMMTNVEEMLGFEGDRADNADYPYLKGTPEQSCMSDLNAEENASPFPVFNLSDFPCLWLSTTREQNERYIDSLDVGDSDTRRWLAFGDIIRSLDMIEFTSKERINRLFESRRITENGVSIEIRKEDIPVLRAAVRERIGKNLFLLNEEAQPLPKGYFLYLTRNGKMIFGPYQNSSFLVCVQNWDFVGELYNWFATRISTVNPEI